MSTDIVVCNIRTSEKDPERERLANDIEAYLKKGGKILKVDAGHGAGFNPGFTEIHNAKK